MMNQDRLLVWLGNHFFHAAMRHLGWQVIYRSCPPGTVYCWDDILALTGGRIPDAVVAADFSGPPFVLGMEDFPCLTVFYSVDTHIHSWHPAYAQGFDLCLVSLPDHVQDFYTGRLKPEQAIWSPPYAPDGSGPICRDTSSGLLCADSAHPVPRPSAPALRAVPNFAFLQNCPGQDQKSPAPSPKAAPSSSDDKLSHYEWNMLFVGTVNPELNPARCSFLAEVKQYFPGLHCTTGNFAALFPKARLVLNECARGELNFRIFEALGCGACLLTPDIGPALADLFTDGKELVLYPAHDAKTLATQASALLRDDDRRAAIAAAGLAAVDAGHRASHRAKALASRLHDLLASEEGAGMIAERRSMAGEIFKTILRPLYLHHAESIENESLRLTYLQAAKTK